MKKKKECIKWSRHIIYKEKRKKSSLITQLHENQKTNPNKSGCTFSRVKSIFALESLLMHCFIMKFVPNTESVKLRNLNETP